MRKPNIGQWALLGLSAAVALWLWRPWDPVSHLTLAPAAGRAEPIPPGVGEITEGFELEVTEKGLSLPWDLAFLGEDEVLVTEKAGRLLRINLVTHQRTSIDGVPAVKVQGQGGLHVVLLHPQFEQNRWVYLSYAASEGAGATTTVSRGRLEGDHLVDVKEIFRAQAPVTEGVHFGGAMAIDQQGFLFLSVGDRGFRDNAQSLSSHNGKIMRLRDDGSVPNDNPFAGMSGALPEIWSFGHRNPQGLSFDFATGRLWESEHGPQGGDELNVIERGRDYGWPIYTYGREYGSGVKIGLGTESPKVRSSIHHYVPSIATCGLAVYRGAAFPQWTGNILIAALRGHLNKVSLTGDDAFAHEDRFLNGKSLRIRSVRVSPAGIPYLVTDNGAIVRLKPTPER